MNNVKHFIISLLFIIITGCTPDEFILNKNEGDIHGKIWNGLDGMEVIGQNAMRIHSKARVSLRTYYLTQLFADLTVELRNGDNLKLAVRTNAVDWGIHPNITLDFSTEGMVVRENGVPVPLLHTMKAQLFEPRRVQITNDGSLVEIRIDCDTLCRFRTILPETEYLYIEGGDQTEALITGISFSAIE